MSFDISIENLIKDLNKKNKINNILHIGACLGEEMPFYKMLSPKLIYWFEPNPKLLDRLTTNVNSDEFISKVFPYAVSSKKGQLEFNIIEDESNSNPGCSSLNNLKIHSELYPHLKLVDKQLVDTIVLDEFLSENNLETNFDLVSIDTQGHDYEILTSSNIIFNSNIIVIETSKLELYENQKVQSEIDSILLKRNFHKHYYHAFHDAWGDTLYIKI